MGKMPLKLISHALFEKLRKTLGVKMKKLLITASLILFSSVSLAKDLDCKTELETEYSRIITDIKDIDNVGESLLTLIFETDEFSSNVEKAQKSHSVFSENFEAIIDQEIISTRKSVQINAEKLKKQKSTSKVCNKRELIKTVGDENVQAYKSVWGMKVTISKMIAQNDGDLTSDLLDEIMTVLSAKM
jgi:hypothetical protein